MTNYTEEDILGQLDQCHKRSEFPDLGNMNIDYVSERLMGYRDDRRWAIVFNWIAWWPAAGDGCKAIVECYGNCIKGKLGFANDRVFSSANFEYRSDYDEEELIGVDIRGHKINLAEAIEDPDAQKHQEAGFRILVSLANKYRESLFASPEEYMKFIPKDLPCIITLDEWFHTNWDRPPSRTETFQLLAKVLMTGDTKYYRPTVKPNTDWRNWIPK